MNLNDVNAEIENRAALAEKERQERAELLIQNVALMNKRAEILAGISIKLEMLQGIIDSALDTIPEDDDEVEVEDINNTLAEFDRVMLSHLNFVLRAVNTVVTDEEADEYVALVAANELAEPANDVCGCPDCVEAYGRVGTANYAA